MGLFKRLLRWWSKRRKPQSKPLKEVKLIYGWASPKIAAGRSCPYVYAFRIIPISNGAMLRYGVRRGAALRRFVHAHLVIQDSYSRFTPDRAELVRQWDEIIPSAARLPTHRIEIGILRKRSGIPRTAFFSEYFCFLPHSGKDSDRIAIQIAGFLGSQLEDARVFDGAALEHSKAHWLLCVFVAWNRFKN